MTPHQERLAEQASTEMDPTKLLVLVDELCRAIDSEIEDSRLLRLGCKRDWKEHSHVFALPAAPPGKCDRCGRVVLAAGSEGIRLALASKLPLSPTTLSCPPYNAQPGQNMQSL